LCFLSGSHKKLFKIHNVNQYKINVNNYITLSIFWRNWRPPLKKEVKRQECLKKKKNQRLKRQAWTTRLFNLSSSYAADKIDIEFRMLFGIAILFSFMFFFSNYQRHLINVAKVRTVKL
jgi:hypothetical protein